MIQPHSRTKPLRKQERNCPAIEIVSQIHRGRAIAFRIEAGGEIGWSKMRNFFPAAFYIQFRVFPRFDNPQDVSDKPQTIRGLFSVPNITASQTI